MKIIHLLGFLQQHDDGNYEKRIHEGHLPYNQETSSAAVPSLWACFHLRHQSGPAVSARLESSASTLAGRVVLKEVSYTSVHPDWGILLPCLVTPPLHEGILKENNIMRTLSPNQLSLGLCFTLIGIIFSQMGMGARMWKP